MSRVVFAGPSLAGTRPPAGVELRGPAEAGDIWLAVRRGARVIGLVDGLFGDRPAPFHNEILWALSQGVRVLGAASLGALRAAELAPFGMEGIGSISARCVDGSLEDDHELAIVHAPAELGFAPAGEALVNVRATLEAAEAAGVLAPASAAALLAIAGATDFRALAWPSLLAEARGAGVDPGGLEAWLPTGRVDLKREDALALLAAVAAAPDAPAPVPDFRFADTRHWREALGWFGRREGAGATGAAVLDELRLDPARFEREMVRAFARRAARGDDAPLDGEDAAAAGLLEELRADLGLGGAAAFREWLVETGTTAEALVAAARDEDRLLGAVDAAIPELAAEVLAALRLDGRFDRLAARAREKRETLAPIREPVLRDADLAGLLDELCQRRGLAVAASDDPDTVARSLGLPDRGALHRLLRRERDYLLLSGREAAP